MRNLRLTLVCMTALFTIAPAFAQSKDTIRLQTQIQEVQDSVARLQQSNDERMGVLKDLVQQSADSVNRLSVNVDALQKQLAAQQNAQGGKTDQVSGQVQGINDSIDEIKARMVRLEKILNDVQSQQQTIGAALQNNAPASGSPAPSQPDAQPQPQPYIPPTSALPPTTTRGGKPSAAIPQAADGPTAQELYKSAYGDYMAAKYPVASSEFGDIIKAYPNDTLAGNAYYYLGEIDYRAGKYATAARSYDRVLEQFPDNNKIPAAYLHKGQALIELKQTDAGVRELRALIQRFPSSPEATQARAKLNALGVPARPRT
ncbi:tetratricopeptide repeat protein [Granulicella tundricola]|uniref:Tetratricopeptide repeat n=1 Tax=Granulicella tundricola (strain ATCC BAA-1859 / DSM 23138 / MP5ACTX9) TaxID=1198114 RepID=E8WXM0_GRATM|nr:tetratricopeptide repeat protein [Granulicella tundricola]ADW68636.1 Tetratricopeptide repeat [Granulicella tundricola MP5ACTX9]